MGTPLVESSTSADYTDVVKFPCIVSKEGKMLAPPLKCAQMPQERLRMLAGALDGIIQWVTFEASYFFAATQLCGKSNECTRPIKPGTAYCSDHQD